MEQIGQGLIKQLIDDGVIDSIPDEAFIEQFDVSKDEARVEMEE